MYSAVTESGLIASVVQVAISVDARAINEIANGLSNLQRRSMRRIRAFKTESEGQHFPAPIKTFMSPKLYSGELTHSLQFLGSLYT
jgi:hypothetical protein